ncbi:PAS domain S-box-containing protein [Methylobacterium phyllostachyos]|uniref:Blue-light-activated histidine kinase n=1 Tax=Methylobacterium phyllostachyos TaxID=582672 RepID=A0A1G9REK2_9HYPH|nr:PAS domain-containing sensor histidine kinase [Methylobacterium phyllostachyos]SDM21732.1 PAS domain S-box-containing protein [Methylobacterium phyllostachyos]
MERIVVLPRADGAEYRLGILEAENARLRDLLAQATAQADRERQRSRRLGRIIEAASRVEAGRLAGERLQPITLPKRDRARDRPDIRTPLAGLRPAASPPAANDYLELLDRDGCVITASEGGPALSGACDEAEVIGHPWIQVWTRPEDRDAVAVALDRARQGRPSRFQAQLAVGAGIRWWDVAVTPIGATPGSPERILTVSRDITELKLAEAHQTLLMQELAHRMKNTIAMVQAVAAQTMRNAVSLESAGEALSARLLALAKAHDVLLQGSFARASLVGLVAGAVSLHDDGMTGRFRISGPDVTLGSRHGLTLALMLHELGTNAAKYGALSVADGRVGITWAVIEAESGPQLRFRWEETCGPPVTPPTRSGFGTRLIARSLVHGFGGTAQLSYPPEGAVLIFEAPLEAVTVD